MDAASLAMMIGTGGLAAFEKWPRRNRQRDEEAGAFGLALEGNFAVVALDDGLRDRQPHPGALAGILGGEKRIEDAAAMLFGNSRPSVLKDHQDARRGLGLGAHRDGQSSPAHAHRI